MAGQRSFARPGVVNSVRGGLVRASKFASDLDPIAVMPRRNRNLLQPCCSESGG